MNYILELYLELYFEIILRLAALENRGSSNFVAKRQSREARRRNCLHNYAPIKRADYRRQERKREKEDATEGSVAEWLMRATAISIPAQLRCG